MNTLQVGLGNRQAQARQGAALVIVMVISGILLIAATAMMALSAQSLFRMRRLTLDSQSLSIAEAGIADMIGRLTEDYLHWQTNTNAMNFGNGSFHVVTHTLPGGSVVITSTGVINGVSRTTAVELLGTDRDRNDSLFSLNGAIFSGGDVRFNTAAFTIKGNVHSNNEIVTGPGNAAANATFAPADGAAECYVSAVGDVDGILNATLQPNVTERELPEFNFDSYRQLAITNGIYLEGNQTLRNLHTDGNETVWYRGSGNNTKTNALAGCGIIYVNGDVTVSNGNNQQFKGTLVVNGNITLSNQYDHEVLTPGMPGIMATGTVTLNNNGSIEGLVYAGVNVLITNHVSVDGGIISVGYTEVSNNCDVEHPSDMPPWDPLQPAVPPDVIVGGWVL